MKIYYFTRAYNSYGAGATHSNVGAFLEHAVPGEAFGVVELLAVANFPASRSARPTLERHYEEFHQRLSLLPEIKYQRKKQSLSVEFKSRLGSAEPIIGDHSGAVVSAPRGPDAKVFRASLTELIDVLRSLTEKLRRKPGLKFTAFVDEVVRAAETVPESDEEILELCQHYAAEARATQVALQWWKRVDWGDYHSKARILLDDPVFWDPTNDAWFDVLTDFRLWRRRNRNAPALEFLDKLFRQWGVREGRADQRSGEDLLASIRDEGRVALAFAQIKIDGVCDPSVREAALAAIDRQFAEGDDARSKWRAKLLEFQ